MAEAQNRTLQLLLALGFPMAMGIAVLSGELVQFFTQENFGSYGPAVTVLAILAWFLPFSFANGLLQYALIAVNRQAAITRAFLIGALFNLATNLVAIPVAAVALGRPDWALYAAAVITVLSELVLYLVFRPLLAAEGLAPTLLRISWRPLLAALAMGAAMLGLKLLVPGWPGALLATLGAPLVYGALLWGLGGIGAEERALALRVLGRAPR
jgi:O-antigen/teichoic acid export membrane protein